MSTRKEINVRDGLGLTGRVLVILVLTSWCLVFLFGILVDTEPFRAAISPSGFAKSFPGSEAPMVESYSGELVWAWAVVCLCFTPTNLVILCVFAGILGALGKRASLHHDVSGDSDPPDLVNPYFSALLRALLVFLVMISGVLIVSENPFANPSPSQYLRLGGIVSLISFIVNYQPRVFGALLRRVTEVLETGKLGTKAK